MQNTQFLKLIKKLGGKVTPIDKYKGVSKEEVAKYKQQVYEATGVYPTVIIEKDDY